MSEIIKTPWTSEQVKALNLYQKSSLMHPYTCGGNRKDKNHLVGEGVLAASENGWFCPYCDYKPDWASTVLIKIVELRSCLKVSQSPRSEQI